MPPSLFQSGSLEQTAQRIHAGERLSREDAAILLRHHHLSQLGLWAQEVRARLRPGNSVGYSIGGALAFRATEENEGSGADVVFSHARRLRALGATEVRLYAGDPAPRLQGWDLLLAQLASDPQTASLPRSVDVASVTRLAQSEALEISAVFSRLRAAGVEFVRGETTGPGRGISSPEWLMAQEAAHHAGLPSSAAICEDLALPDALVSFLLDVRDLQDRTGLFQSFTQGPVGIPRGGDPTVPGAGSATAFSYLRTLVVCRCVVDNIPHFEIGWESPGTKIAQVALTYGADDFGATGIALSDAASGRPSLLLPIEEIERLTRDAGFSPCARDGMYRDAAVAPIWDRELPVVSG